jgi:DNA-binding winged helix-turn-helix (wHTH) protein/TolB-like protein
MSIRFGIFEFRPHSGELYREGAQVRLQAQPTQVLNLLLQHSDRVVTRTELKDAIWGSDTFVDFDKGLNFCIAQVRAALGDSADAPVYIKTIPKLGYQFIAPVGSSADEPTRAAQILAPPPASGLHSRALWLSALATLIVVSGALFAWGRHARHAQPHDIAAIPATRVAIARFDNETGNPQFDRLADALSDSVTAKLTIAGANRYSVIGNAAILRVPRSQRDLTAIGATLNVGYVVLAQVRHDSSHFFILAHLIRLPDQTHVAVTDLTCSPDDSLQNQSDMAQRIADKFSPLIARPRPAAPPHTAM